MTPNIIENDFKNSRYWSPRFKNVDFNTVLEVPLIFKGEKLGVLAVVNEEEPFMEHQVYHLQELANHAILIIQYIKMVKKLNQRVKDLEIIDEFSKQITLKLNNDSLYNTIVQEIEQKLNCIQCTIFLPDVQGYLVPRGISGPILFEEIKDVKFRPGRPPERRFGGMGVP